MLKLMVILISMSLTLKNSYANSSVQHFTLARNALFDNLYPVHEDYVMDHFENITFESCVLFCLKNIPLCSGLLYNDKLKICNVMMCLLNIRFLEEGDGWKFFGNYKACESGWHPFEGHCYYLNETKVTWKAAKTQCTQKNSYLVEMNSAKENKWISEMFLSENGNGNTHLVDTTWIGANRKNGILTWEHSNEPVNLQSWVTNRLDGSGSCVFMEYTGSWTDVRCDRQLHVYAFVCEKML